MSYRQTPFLKLNGEMLMVLTQLSEEQGDTAAADRQRVSDGSLDHLTITSA